MLFTNLPTMALAACALLDAVVLGSAIPDPDLLPQSRSLDVTVRFWDSIHCKHGGPKRGYNRGTCINLAASSHGVSIQDKHEGCYMISYRGSDCHGTASHHLDQVDKCYDIGDGIYSLKFFC